MISHKLFEKLSKATFEYHIIHTEYDNMIRDYEGENIFQSEAYIIKWINASPGITMSEMAKKTHKTKSSFSQILKKLIVKGFVIQERNPENRRLFNLYLTEKGKRAYFKYEEERKELMFNSFEIIEKKFSQKDIETFINIQEELNNAVTEKINDFKNKNKKK